MKYRTSQNECVSPDRAARHTRTVAERSFREVSATWLVSAAVFWVPCSPFSLCEQVVAGHSPGRTKLGPCPPSLHSVIPRGTCLVPQSERASLSTMVGFLPSQSVPFPSFSCLIALGGTSGSAGKQWWEGICLYFSWSEAIFKHLTVN